MKVKSEREVTQSCPTLSDPMDCSLPGSSVHGILPLGVVVTGEGHKRLSVVLKRYISLSVGHMGTNTLVESIQLCTLTLMYARFTR